MLCAPHGDGIKVKRPSLSVAAATGVRRLIPALVGIAGLAGIALIAGIALVAGIALLGLLTGVAFLRLLRLILLARARRS
jgi:hypothetical protein